MKINELFDPSHDVDEKKGCYAFSVIKPANHNSRLQGACCAVQNLAKPQHDLENICGFLYSLGEPNSAPSV